MSAFADEPIELSDSIEDLEDRYIFGFAGEPGRFLIIMKSPDKAALAVFIDEDETIRELVVNRVFRYPEASAAGAAYIDTDQERIVLPAATASPERVFPYYGVMRLYDLTD